MGYVCITLVVCNTVGETFLARELHKLEFKTCLNNWSTWRLALDNVEQSQGSYVIVGLVRERYVEKSIIYIPLRVYVSYIGIRAFIGCSRCHKAYMINS